MSLLFNMLYRFVIAFLLGSKHLLISPSAVILEPKKRKSVTASIFLYLPWCDGTRCHLSLFHVEFQASFFTLLFTLVKTLFSSSSISAIRMVSSAYLRLSVFLQATMIAVCDSSSTAILIMYAAYKLNKQGGNIQPCHTPFPVWNQSIVPCPVLTVASWPVYRFLKRQVKWSGTLISVRIFHSLLWFFEEGQKCLWLLAVAVQVQHCSNIP